MKKNCTIRVALAGAALAAFSLAGPAVAQSGAEFYKGKTVTYIVATSPGGGYDTYGRLVAEYMQKYLPGSTFVVRNMPGAGHLVGTNAIYASKPDGLEMLPYGVDMCYADGVRFDLSKMSWVGKAASESRIVAVAAQSPIKTWQDLVSLKDPVNFAVAGPGGQPQGRRGIGGLPLLTADAAIGFQHVVAEGFHPAHAGIAGAMHHLQAQLIGPETARAGFAAAAHHRGFQPQIPRQPGDLAVGVGGVVLHREQIPGQ